ncbi:hypothetical protein IMG5_138860 [Ichthyophthirius multifiliis]|uniref:Enoyl-CoA hydratase/isomerase family protein n=1 Tax=Ichthyophthirius multifiliis TaxID=5932 RepID=G0QX74_ICHMU|nr:hypothetical protein IMG5_138860 [Ichthyophthirius multifiliis]EGR30182.1 hypothetical protein IMG5_138860 [Ichthyophthirius multifiliis]|eukprot:XP_004031418.1 hypothetical protein IMG5_138860 [Ichthyophthirius multifiliis]
MSKIFSTSNIEKVLKITEEDKKQEAFLKKTETGIHFIILNRKVNSFTLQFIRKINELLDEVEKNEGPTALVTFGLNPKFFSTGLDLNYLLTQEKNEIYAFILEVIRLYGRLLAFPVPCISMINGHAYAGGCMLALAHDYRIMRNDFGQLCMNEVELGMYLPPGMNAVLQDKIQDKNAFRDLVLLAKKFESKEAFQKGLVDKIVDPEQLFEECVQFAESVSKFGVNKENFKKLKEEMNKNAIDCCFNKGHAVGVRAETQFKFPNPRL